MKRVIDGKVYETAKKVCQLASTSEWKGDIRWHITHLYRTPRGRFFIAGEGGPWSMWGRDSGTNTMTSGRGLRPVSVEEAREHMEDAGCDIEQFEEVGLAVEHA